MARAAEHYGGDVDTLRQRLRMQTAQDRQRRYVEQGDSSEEEGLAKTMFCSGCGNYRCQRMAMHCRDGDKVLRLSRLLETLNPEVGDGYAEIPKVSVAFLVSLTKQVA